MIQEKLISARKLKKISQQEIADYIGISTKTYSLKENGKSQFTIDEMFKIANFFDKKIEEIFLPSILQNGVNKNGG